MNSEALAEVQALCPNAAEMTEAGLSYISLPGLRVFSNGTSQTVDALLCLQQYCGYTTKLFLSQQVTGKVGWSAYVIMGRTWYSWSWQNVPAHLRPAEILISHLRALR